MRADLHFLRQEICQIAVLLRLLDLSKLNVKDVVGTFIVCVAAGRCHEDREGWGAVGHQVNARLPLIHGLSRLEGIAGVNVLPFYFLCFKLILQILDQV